MIYGRHGCWPTVATSSSQSSWHSQTDEAPEEEVKTHISVRRRSEINRRTVSEGEVNESWSQNLPGSKQMFYRQTWWEGISGDEVWIRLDTSLESDSS